jgi:hypothetical protein
MFIQSIFLIIFVQCKVIIFRKLVEETKAMTIAMTMPGVSTVLGFQYLLTTSFSVSASDMSI